MATQNVPFINALKNIGFSEEMDHANTYQIRNRDVAYDNDCSDDDRDDSFHDQYAEKFANWVRPKIKAVRELAKTHGVKVELETAGEYGLLLVEVK